jgi:hypothetical protein
MKNKLLITTALASSLVAGSAMAQTTVTGSLGVSYKSVQGKNGTVNGNSFGKESQINVANKGKLNIGGLSYAAGFSLEFDGADGIYSYSPNVTSASQLSSGAAAVGSLTATAQISNVATATARQTGSSGWHLENNYIDIISESTGTTLTISSDHIQNGRGGLAHIVGQHAEDFTGGVNKTTTSLAMDYAGTSVAESFGVGIVQNVGKLGKVSYLYVPNHTAQGAQTGKDSVLQAAGVVADDGDAVLGSDDLPNAYEFGFIGDLGVKGLTVKAFKNVEGTKKAANNTSSALSKTKGQTVGVRYNYDIFTVGVNQMKQKVGQTSGIVATTTPSDGAETKQMEYGLGFAVNKDLSVGLYLNKAKRTGDTNNIGNETEKTQSIAVGYSLGPVALSTQYGRVNNMNGIADKDANVLFMSLTTAF